MGGCVISTDNSWIQCEQKISVCILGLKLVCNPSFAQYSIDCHSVWTDNPRSGHQHSIPLCWSKMTGKKTLGSKPTIAYPPSESNMEMICQEQGILLYHPGKCSKDMGKRKSSRAGLAWLFVGQIPKCEAIQGLMCHVKQASVRGKKEGNTILIPVFFLPWAHISCAGCVQECSLAQRNVAGKGLLSPSFNFTFPIQIVPPLWSLLRRKVV